MVRKAVNIFADLLLGFLLLFVALTALPGFLGIRTFVVTSGSMKPKFPVGSLIYVKEAAPEEIRTGDAISFYMGEQRTVATHEVRTVDPEQQQFHTQGINNRDGEGNIIPDAIPVPFHDLIGKAVFCIPLLGLINNFCTSPPGSYLLIAAAVLAALVSFLGKRDTAPHQNKKTEE